MKRNIKVLVVILIILTTVIFISNYKERGTFEELVLNKYLNKAQAKEFDTIQMIDISDRNFVFKSSNNINIINEFLSKFNELELVEYRQGMLLSNNDTKTNKRTYVIFIINKETNEGLQIYIPFDRHMLISISTLSITENKKISLLKLGMSEKHMIIRL